LALAFEVDLCERTAQSAAEVIPSIILAAGASSRMGSPKALLDYRGETFLDRLIRVMGTATNPVIVVLGYHAERIRGATRRPATFVVNTAPERGQLSSLQTGLAAMPPQARGFAFIPMDCPAVREDTVTHLAAAFSARDAETLFVIPRQGDKRGHPVFAAPQIAEELLGLPADGQARDVVHRHVSRTQYIDVDDVGILADIDDPEAYRKLLEPVR
jgi:molybdenum cofactor cytidylyltransferase